MQKYKKIEHFIEIEPLHILAHQFGHSIVQLCDEGQLTKAKALSQELLKLKNLILEKLLALQKKVVSYQ